jgi:hypothetical protein
MKVLILHPEDRFKPGASRNHYDLVADLGRAPSGTYENWRKQSGSQVISLFDFAQENEDFNRIRFLARLGGESLMDRMGIDWWPMLLPEIVPRMEQQLLVNRLSRHIGKKCEIYSSRSDYRSAALHYLLGGRLINLEYSLRTLVRRFQHYSQVATDFDARQILQIAQDKFDRERFIRRRFGRPARGSSRPIILLPSAYTSVSRMALGYAKLLPDEQFLLVCARDNAKLRELPANVQMKSLDRYFSAPDASEISSLSERWEALRTRLIDSAPEYESGAAVGLFDRIPSLLHWEITIRDAWKRLFDSENIRSCFSADHTNPYTRIPLLLAKHAGIPAVACHHGALDVWMAITTHDADYYIAKNEMEHDYMTRVCGINTAKVLQVAPPRSVESFPSSGDPETAPPLDIEKKRWLVFFTEPYGAWALRMDEVYRELLPPLCALAKRCGLKLVFKLHPFESERGHRNLLLRLLPREKVRGIEIITGPIPEKLWRNTKIALTVESSVALECAARGIPIFLCGWLRDSFTGYTQQYQKFGVGHLLENVGQINNIPNILESAPAVFNARHDPSSPGSATETLRELLLGLVPVPIAAKG